MSLKRRSMALYTCVSVGALHWNDHRCNLWSPYMTKNDLFNLFRLNFLSCKVEILTDAYTIGQSWVLNELMKVWKVKLLSRVRLFATPWTIAHQVPPSMGFSRQEYWSGVPLPSLPYQATKGIFHRARANNFTICMEIQKTSHSQKQSWERRMELEESTCLTSGSTTKPQSSRQYGTGTKTGI